MKCPKCGSEKNHVIDSRGTSGGSAVRRRRVCEGCNERFTTYEAIDGSVEVAGKNAVLSSLGQMRTQIDLLMNYVDPPPVPDAREIMAWEID